MKAPWGIHWFRRDLRIVGNTALQENLNQTQGRTVALFCFDSKFLARSDFSHNRFAFFLQTLRALKEDLKQRGGDLLVINCIVQEAFPRLLNYWKRKAIAAPSLVTWGRDYEPFARARDAQIEKILKDFGIAAHHYRDHLLFEPHEILKNQHPERFYQVYTPYSKKWLDALKSPTGRERIRIGTRDQHHAVKNDRAPHLFKMRWANLRKSDFPFADALEKFIRDNHKHVTVSIPEAGYSAANEKLRQFKSRIARYHEDRNLPALEGTSGLSPYFKNGSLTGSQAISFLRLSNLHCETEDGPSTFLKELIWREFYYSILYHKPEVEHQSFLPQYENLVWKNNRSWFRRWKEGTTGFPIVDAGMRELVTTGRMHNRVRMIVASFLTKDLLIDWRWGENYFMKQLLDGDLAANNGGWQWAASTGCDPQPYFRIFNPWLQSRKYDPQGKYIKTFLPELREAPVEVLHQATADRSQWHYPSPIVNHVVQADHAIHFYKQTARASKRIY
ncbi:MAG: deoxyribodipyrimidine photo-lyase [Verrucomicrobia bacterium]|nr:MAG: deoxyribodipyrimidine photo-lyase [Verrucomicrobiota bacterium]